MAAIQALILKDGASTPVDHTLTPDFGQTSERPAQWSEKTSANLLLRLRATLRASVTAGGVSKVTAVTALPTPFAPGANCCPTGTDPVVSRLSTIGTNGTFAPLSTEQERLDVLAEHISFLQSDPVKEAVRNGTIAW